MSGFWDTFTDTSAGGFLKAADKEFLIENGIIFPISKVEVSDHPEYGERYLCAVEVPNAESGDTEARTLAFPVGTVESRDRMLDAMSKWLDDPDNENPRVKLTKVGRSLILQAA